jgi:hypothetical protein
MADLSSLLGGMVQGFKDFGTGLVDFFGTGAANIGDVITGLQTGHATTKNQDDFRKWLYNTDSTQDAAAKGLGTILNGVSTVADVIPGAQAITANPMFNGLQGAVGGVADELKMNGENADWGKAAQRAGIGAASGLASGYAGQALGNSGNKLLSNGLTRGAVTGALGGGIANAGYTGIEGGSVQDMINAGLYGAQTGALVGGTTGLARELIKPTHKMDVALTDDEKAARIANIDDQLGKLDLNTPEGNARYNELAQQRQQYSGNKRLYRGLGQEYDPNYPKNKLDTQGYESWTDNPELARQYGDNVYYIDVPEGDIKTSYLDENPMSETYGDRNPIYSIDKKAGLNGVSGNEYLLSVDDPYKEGLTYNRLGSKPKTVADLMNEPKQKTVADLMLSPDDDVMYSKAAAPIEVRQDSSLLDDRRKRALDLITHKDTPAANELYDRIDPSTLPAGYDKLRKLLDTNIVDESLEKKLGKHPLRADADELLDYLYPNDPLEKRVYHKSLKESIEKYKKDAAALGVDASKAEQDMTRNKRYELVQKAYEKAKFDAIANVGDGIDVGDDILYATQDIRHRGIRTGYPAALDTALSERLGIAPGNTIKVTDSAYDYIDKDFRNKNVGRYTNQPKDIAIREGILGIEGDISAMAHERLHSFQNEAKPENAGRYSKEVADAYNQLSKDLEPFIKSDEEINRLYKNKDTEYYAKKNEQESRMLQAYLDNNGITQDAQYWHNKSIGGQPEWGNEINPAFDKFFDKLRALSKKGVALPALTALFGGGAIAGALTSGKDDKKKKSEVK